MMADGGRFIVMMGATCAGKTTTARALGEDHGFAHVSLDLVYNRTYRLGQTPWSPSVCWQGLGEALEFQAQGRDVVLEGTALMLLRNLKIALEGLGSYGVPATFVLLDFGWRELRARLRRRVEAERHPSLAWRTGRRALLAASYAYARTRRRAIVGGVSASQHRLVVVSDPALAPAEVASAIAAACAQGEGGEAAASGPACSARCASTKASKRSTLPG